MLIRNINYRRAAQFGERSGAHGSVRAVVGN